MEYARLFVLQLYSKKAAKSTKTLDELRYVLSCKTEKTGALLPPTEDSFKQHVLRAKLQTMVWCMSHEPDPILPDPVDHGWIRGSDCQLTPKFGDMDCAPIQLRDMTHLFCNDKNCNQSSKCACLLAGLRCIDICSCTSCSNQPNVNPLDEENEDI